MNVINTTYAYFEPQRLWARESLTKCIPVCKSVLPYWKQYDLLYAVDTVIIETSEHYSDMD